MMKAHRLIITSILSVLSVAFAIHLEGKTSAAASRGALLASAQNEVGTILRTFAYHQITSFTSNLIINSTPLLSGNGNRAVFAQAPGPEPVRTSHIFVINADGTEQR